jgi:hypothetical protein
MTSPFVPYQTARDLMREKQIITCLSVRWQFDYEKMGDFSTFDFICRRNGKVVAYIEVKTKTRPYVDFDTYICTKQDIDYGLKLSKEENVPAFLVVKWPDYFGYLRIVRNDYESRKSGQRNRNDPRDYDTICYLIPREEFREIKGFEFNE